MLTVLKVLTVLTVLTLLMVLTVLTVFSLLSVLTALAVKRLYTIQYDSVYAKLTVKTEDLKKYESLTNLLAKDVRARDTSALKKEDILWHVLPQGLTPP